MGILKKRIEEHKIKKQQQMEFCKNIISEIDDAILFFTNQLNDKTSFIEPFQINEWKLKYSDLFDFMSHNDFRSIRKINNSRNLKEKIIEFQAFEENIKDKINNHNTFVAENKVDYAYELIGNVEGHKLDFQQMLCIVKDAYNHVVIAGAGTGKTTTIIGKIKYLLKTGIYRPEEIMVLSFTNASASEMKERIKKETDLNIYASTFHKLGVNIIKRVEGKVPKITNLDFRKFIISEIHNNISDNIFLKNLCEYHILDDNNDKTEFEFHSQYEYNEYLRCNPPKTLKGEIVKSYGEVEIANFLAKNGISYVYEKEYEIDTRDEEYAQYYPDFYLPDFGIYIEYFGVDEKGNVPSYFKSAHNKSAKEEYHDKIKWKRNLHKLNNTTLIECYAYQFKEKVLITNLENELKHQKVIFNPLTPQELWNTIENKNEFLNIFSELLQTIINLIKSKEYTIDYIRKSYNLSIKEKVLLDIVEKIYNSYNDYLIRNGEIDFNDMINLATKYTSERKFVSKFKVVIVDEYQDISSSRFRLLKALRESCNYNLFCVGDDWQSIYRFAGSEISYITNFDAYWGPSVISMIETTYRFPKKLIELSSSFIMKNPNQIKKCIIGKKEVFGEVIGDINGYQERNVIHFMLNKLDELPKDSTVYFIGRYSFEYKMLEIDNALKCKFNNVTKMIDVFYNKRADLKMCFLTAHRSKGLQADYVFIINNKNSRLGFPSKVQDASILRCLLEDNDSFSFAEERRLYYVALTRAKKKVFLLTMKNKESIFASEIKTEYKNEINKEKYECPLCGATLVKHEGKYGTFYGCSNYKETGCKFIRKRN